MKPWHEVVVPHTDIRKGKFDESVFAADLSDVVADRGPLEYRNASTFFRKTYPTQGLINLLSAILSRLSGQGKGEPVIQIQTPFGGGKTHSLIALYHLFEHSGELKGLDATAAVLKESGVKAIPEVRVAAFVGTAADPLKGKTPWGSLAGDLGNYPLLRDNDKKRRAPGKDLLHELLGNKPTLILMDEIAEYAVKAKDFGDQVMAFFQELTETVKVLPQCALVATLPSSAPYGEEGEKALQQLQRIFGRVEAVYTPVEGEEIYEVIRRRLFEDVPDPTEARGVADNYWEMYQRLGDDVPRETREPAYRDKMRKAYPFHPELIDILFERWSTFPTFQRTRGVLRLLAEIVADLYKREHPAPLIQPAHLNLGESTIRREFLKHIGNEFEGVIGSDIAGTNAKAPKIDREMGSEYARFGIASGLATAIFFGSFSGGDKRGMVLQRLRIAVLRDGIPPAVVGDALRRLEDDLWYLHEEGGVYSFSSQPNLNRVIVEKEEAVKDEPIIEEIRTRLEKASGTELRVTLWPKASQDVQDNKELKLSILSPDQTYGASATKAFVEDLLKKCGTPFRTYQNTLLALAADTGEASSLRQQVKRVLALRSIRDDKPLMRQLSEENRKTLETKLKDTDALIPFLVLSAYRHFAKAGEGGVEWFDLGLPTVGDKGSLAKRVRDYLKIQDLLLTKISPDRLLKKTLREDEQEKPLSDIYEAFLKYTQLPMLEGEDVVRQAAAQGVRDSLFGVKVADRIYFGETLPASANDYGAVLVRKEIALRAKAEGKETQVTPEPESEGGKEKKGRDGEEPELPKPKPAVGVRTLRLRVQVPWDKIGDFVRGVVMPLRADGAEIQVEVLIEAQSVTASIKPSTLEQKVKETLNQIGAKVLEDSRE
jgi:Protein of unknown function (DUF499)